MRKKLLVIGAACRNNGIGANGDLPWRLKKEMAFFTRITKTTVEPDKQNAVIMGRKTWDCIPPKYRPLPGRINVVLSETLAELPTGAHYLFKSLPDAVAKLSTIEAIDKLFVIGGERVYKTAIESPDCHRIYLTKIDADFECDAFFPEFDTNLYSVSAGDESVPSDEQEENGIKYRFYVYDRN